MSGLIGTPRRDVDLRHRRGPSALRTEIITELDDLIALTDEWRDLLERSPLTEPVLTPTWLITWWRVFGRSGGRRLHVVTFRDREARLVGLAPLLCRVAFRAKILPFVRLELLGTGEDADDEIVSTYLGLIVEAGQEAAVARQLVDILRESSLCRWDELQISELDATDRMIDPLTQALRREGCHVESISAGSGPCISLPDSWTDYLSSLESRHRYYVRRTMRELENWAGSDGFCLRVADTPEELSQGMDILRALHGQRWSGPRRGGAFSSPLFCEFHDRLSRQLVDGADGQIEVMWLEVRDRPVSALYNIIYRGHVCFYQSGRAMWPPSAVRPGIAIHILAIQRAIAAGHSVYDFCGKEVRYKMSLATGSRPRINLRAVAPTTRARGLNAVRNGAREVARGYSLARRGLQRGR